MTRQNAKDKAERMFTSKGDAILARVLVNDIYDSFEKKLKKECANTEHDFTVSTKELCNILEYFKKNMLK